MEDRGIPTLRVHFDTGHTEDFHDVRLERGDGKILLRGDSCLHLLLTDRILYVTRIEDGSTEPARSDASSE
jgi:hypothetical protein